MEVELNICLPHPSTSGHVFIQQTLSNYSRLNTILGIGVTKIDIFYFNLKQFTLPEGRFIVIEDPLYIPIVRGINNLFLVMKMQEI